MSRARSLTSSADASREMPASVSARRDRISTAIDSLREEERRLSRLGLETPLQQCREQRRYWEFLRAVFTIDESPKLPGLRRGVGA